MKLRSGKVVKSLPSRPKISPEVYEVVGETSNVVTSSSSSHSQTRRRSPRNMTRASSYSTHSMTLRPRN